MHMGRSGLERHFRNMEPRVRNTSSLRIYLDRQIRTLIPRLLCLGYALPCNEDAKLSQWEDKYDIIIILGTQDYFDFHVHQDFHCSSNGCSYS